VFPRRSDFVEYINIKRDKGWRIGGEGNERRRLGYLWWVWSVLGLLALYGNCVGFIIITQIYI